MKRSCPNCSKNSVPVDALILSDAECANCMQRVGIHWLFRAVFFIVILAATLLTALVVAMEQGVYAALLMISLPIGAIGYIKARFCPLVVRRPTGDRAGL